MVSVASSHSGSGPGKSASNCYFDFIRAERQEDLNATYRIRYQVYCLERGFLDPLSYPKEMEQDEYDAHAVHVLASHRNGSPAGSARLVLHSSAGFPLLGHCELLPRYSRLADPLDPGSVQYAEISRLAVSKVFRRREGDSIYGGPPRFHASRGEGAEVIAFPVPPAIPEIVSGIYRRLYQESKRLGVLHWVVAMERGLHVVLRRMGFNFSPIGPKVDYFGPVRPYIATISALENHLYHKVPAVLGYMIEGLEPDLYPICIRDAGGLDPRWLASG